MRHAFVATLLLCTAALALGGCAPKPRLERNATVVVVKRDPPVEVTEVDPGPREGWVWARGYWAWNGHDYDAVRGHWERVRPGYHYIHPHWENRKGQWILLTGTWVKD
ncbi:YXWGXW repeat-containing protein [Bacillus sp. NP157]|nr:YXWGXW repeat-containing protein [Bacillus sp. NP157]